MPQEIRARLTKKLSFLIRARTEADSLDRSLYAINWFSTPRPRLYRLYNLLVFPAARRAGASPIFKGDVVEIPGGDASLFRDQLLIVRYPSGAAFRDLVQTTWFKLVSALRTRSTTAFTFGFAEKQLHTPAGPDRKARAYAVLAYRGTAPAAAELRALVTDHEVALTFAGRMVADLYSVAGDRAPRAVPNLMDGIVLFEAASPGALRTFLAATATVRWRAGLAGSFLGEVRRSL